MWRKTNQRTSDGRTDGRHIFNRTFGRQRGSRAVAGAAEVAALEREGVRSLSHPKGSEESGRRTCEIPTFIIKVAAAAAASAAFVRSFSAFAVISLKWRKRGGGNWTLGSAKRGTSSHSHSGREEEKAEEEFDKLTIAQPKNCTSL